VAETYLGQLTLTPLFQEAGTTTFNFLRVQIIGPGTTRPSGWGYEYMEVSADTYILHPRPRIFPWGGPLGTALDPDQLTRMNVTPGLPRRVFLRSLRQVGIVVNVYVGLEGDYFK